MKTSSCLEDKTTSHSKKIWYVLEKYNTCTYSVYNVLSILSSQLMG